MSDRIKEIREWYAKLVAVIEDNKLCQDRYLAYPPPTSLDVAQTYCGELLTLLTAATARADAAAWQPIETAPRDGTEVIVGVDIATVWIVRSAAFVYGHEWCEYPIEKDGWWAYENSISQELLEGMYEPTYWMPLPNPPEQTP